MRTNVRLYVLRYPRGLQRSTYRLQLPYKYGLPLLLLSALLHWLVSQSLFLVRGDVFDPDGIQTRHSTTTVGYSLIAIITVIVVGSIAAVVAALERIQTLQVWPADRW